MAGTIRIGEILVRAGVIDQHQLNAALGEQRRWGKPLGATLVKLGFVDERDLVRALASQLALPVASLDGKRIAPKVLDLVPLEMAHEHMVLPLFVKQAESRTTLFLAMEDPGDLAVLDDLAFRTGMQVKPVMMSPSEICEGIDRYYRDRVAPTPEVCEPAPPEAPAADADGTEELVRHFTNGAAVAAPTADAGEHETIAAGAGEPAQLESDDTADTLLDEAHLAAPPPRTAPPEGEEALVHPPLESLASYEAKTRTILHVLTQLLIEKGVITRDEFHSRVSALSAVEAEQR